MLGEPGRVKLKPSPEGWEERLPEAPARTSGTEPADGLPQPARRYAMITLCMAVAMSVLDGAIANIALPTIAIDLNTSPAASIWVVNAYQLAVTVSLLPFASLGDIYGYRRCSMAGLSVFTAASLGCSAFALRCSCSSSGAWCRGSAPRAS